MAGPNLEVYKFGLYMFFPIWVMLKFGDPEWYDTNVLPYKNLLWPAYENTHRPPRSQPELQAELARLKEERQAKRARAALARGEAVPAPTGESTSPSAGDVGRVQAELSHSGSAWKDAPSDRLV